jgi:hypothetical protein
MYTECTCTFPLKEGKQANECAFIDTVASLNIHKTHKRKEGISALSEVTDLAQMGFLNRYCLYYKPFITLSDRELEMQRKVDMAHFKYCSMYYHGQTTGNLANLDLNSLFSCHGS